MTDAKYQALLRRYTMKQCKQCGDMKPPGKFRKYYGGRKGSYSVCLDCERINNRYKYLNSKDPSTLDRKEENDLNKIEQLWAAQRELGLQPPRIGLGKQTSKTDTLDDMLARYTKSAQESKAKQEMLGHEPTIPDELQHWLNLEEPLNAEPSYYLDKVYEDLKKKYRPVIRVDHDTLLPVYDETYKSVLEQILARFYEYEDAQEGNF